MIDLKKKRKELGLTLLEIAKAIDVSEATVIKMGVKILNKK